MSLKTSLQSIFEPNIRPHQDHKTPDKPLRISLEEDVPEKEPQTSPIIPLIAQLDTTRDFLQLPNTNSPKSGLLAHTLKQAGFQNRFSKVGRNSLIIKGTFTPKHKSSKIERSMTKGSATGRRSSRKLDSPVDVNRSPAFLNEYKYRKSAMGDTLIKEGPNNEKRELHRVYLNFGSTPRSSFMTPKAAGAIGKVIHPSGFSPEAKAEALNIEIHSPGQSLRRRLTVKTPSSCHPQSHRSSFMSGTPETSDNEDSDSVSVVNPRTHKILKRGLLAVYFIGIMFTMKNKVAVYGALRPIEYLTAFESIQPEVKAPKSFPILPLSNFSFIWAIIMTFFLVISALLTPVYISFANDDITFRNLNITIDIIFGIDILIHFISAFNDPNQNLITDFRKIIFNYLKVWFWIDLLAVFPFEELTEGAEKNSVRQAHKIFTMLRFPKLYRLPTFLQRIQQKILLNHHRYTKPIKKLLMNVGVIKIVNLVIIFLFFTHLVACLWFYMARMNNFNANTWVGKSDLVDQSAWAQYIASIHWSLQTLTSVGFGDIVPENSLETTFANIWMIFGVGVYSLIIGSLYTIIQSFNLRSESLKEKLRAFEHFAFHVDLPGFLTQNIRRHFEINDKEHAYYSMDPKCFMNNLPATLRTSVLLYSYYALIKNIRFLQTNPNLTASLIVHFKLLHLKEGEILYRENDPALEIFFISKGCVKFTKERSKGIFSLAEGTYFGETEVFDNIKRRCFCQAVKPTVLIVCPKRPWLTILNEFPDIEAQMRKISQLRTDQFIKKIEDMENRLPSPDSPTSPSRPGTKLKTLMQATAYMTTLISWHSKNNDKKEEKAEIKSSKSLREKPLPRQYGITNLNIDENKLKSKSFKERTLKKRSSFLSWGGFDIKSLKRKNTAEQDTTPKTNSIYSTLKHLKDDDTSDHLSSLAFKSKGDSLTTSEQKDRKFEAMLDRIENETVTSLLTPTGKSVNSRSPHDSTKKITFSPTLPTEVDSPEKGLLKTQSLNTPIQSILSGSKISSIFKGKSLKGYPSHMSKVAPIMEDKEEADFK